MAKRETLSGAGETELPPFLEAFFQSHKATRQTCGNKAKLWISSLLVFL